MVINKRLGLAIFIIILIAFVIGVWQLPRLLSNYYVDKGVRTQQPSQAIAHYDQAIKFNPNNEEAYYLRGTAYMFMGSYENALSDFSRAIELNPEDSFAYGDRAYVYFNFGEVELALADYDRSLQLDPTNPFYYYSRGSVYYEIGDFESALRDFKAAIALPTTDEFRQFVEERIRDIEQSEDQQ